MREIYPAKVYVVDVFDLYGVFEKRLKDPYPSTSYSYYDSVKEAQEDINWRKQNRPNQFEKGDKFKIHSIPFNDAYPGVYGYPHGGRRYNKEQVKKLMAQREEESDSSDDGSSSISWDITDEIENNKSDYKIFMDAVGDDINAPGAMERGKKALKEYHEKIEDRKKRKSASKSKRATNTAVKVFLPTGNKIKSMKNKAEERIKSVYSPITLNLRKKKTVKKVTSRKSTKKCKCK